MSVFCRNRVFSQFYDTQKRVTSTEGERVLTTFYYVKTSSLPINLPSKVATVSVDAWRQCHARHRRTFGRVPRRCCNGHTKRSLPPRRLTVTLAAPDGRFETSSMVDLTSMQVS